MRIQEKGDVKETFSLGKLPKISGLGSLSTQQGRLQRVAHLVTLMGLRREG